MQQLMRDLAFSFGAKMTHDHLQWFSFPSKTFGSENNNLDGLSGIDIVPDVLAPKRR